MAKKNKEKENPNLHVKRYHLEKAEIEKIQAIQATSQMVEVMRQGCENSLYIAVAQARKRLHLDTPESMKAPVGFQRIIDFDPNSYEMLVIDEKVPDVVNAPVPEANKPTN